MRKLNFIGVFFAIHPGTCTKWGLIIQAKIPKRKLIGDVISGGKRQLIAKLRLLLLMEL